MNESLPMYEVEELSLEEAVLLMASEEEKQKHLRAEDGILVYGLMARVTDNHPEKNPKLSHWWFWDTQRDSLTDYLYP